MSNKTPWKNWAENVECHPFQYVQPTSEEALRQLVLWAKKEGRRIRLMGSGHSFTPLCATEDCLVNIHNLRGVIQADKAAKQATVWAGTPLHQLSSDLLQRGLAQVNMGDIDRQSVAGATATGTHGTGIHLGGIATQIARFSIITADGELLECSPEQNADIFYGGRVSLGALGILSRITFQLADAYKLEYTVRKGDLEETLQRLEEYNTQNRNFEFYWFPYTETVQLKFSNETDKPIQDNGFKRWFNQSVMENGLFGFLCKWGRWFKGSYKNISRLTAWGVSNEHRINHSAQIYCSQRTVKFKEMEYNIPAEHFAEVMRTIKKQIEAKQYRVFFPLECRFVQADDIWLSPAYGRASAYIALHVFQGTEHDPYFRDMEAIFKDFGGRPHWGKMHTRTAADLAPAYPKWDDFQRLRAKLDPNGMFLNPHLEQVFGVATQHHSTSQAVFVE